jgi:hypothetical protein
MRRLSEKGCSRKFEHRRKWEWMYIAKMDNESNNSRTYIVRGKCGVHDQRRKECSLLKLAVFQSFRAWDERRIDDSGIGEGGPTNSKSVDQKRREDDS